LRIQKSKDCKYWPHAPASHTDHQINALYQQVLGRTVDASSLEIGEVDLAQGAQLGCIRSYLATQDPESTAAINAIYEDVLGRAVDPAGLSTFQHSPAKSAPSKLARGVTGRARG
jgi:hypothetical protein